MMQSYRKMTNALLRAHEENVISFLRADERFRDCEERAEELGVSISVSIRETYTDLMKSRLSAGETFSSGGDVKFPYGYSSELEIDVVSDGYILNTNPEEGTPVQMTLCETVVRTPETMLFRKVELIPYDEIIESEALFAMLEDFLDMIEERGIGTRSPFRPNEDEPEVLGDPSLHFGTAELGNESYMELQSGSFEGRFGLEDSLYLSPDAFLPHRLLLSHLFGADYRPGISTLNADDLSRWAEQITVLCEALPGALLYDDVLNRMSIYELTPPNRAEKKLSTLCLLHREEFCRNANLLKNHILSLAEAGTMLTVIDAE